MCLEHSLLLAGSAHVECGVWRDGALIVLLFQNPNPGALQKRHRNEIIGLCKACHGTWNPLQEANEIKCHAFWRRHTHKKKKKGPDDQWGRLANWALRYVVGSSNLQCCTSSPFFSSASIHMAKKEHSIRFSNLFHSSIPFPMQAII